MQSCGVLRHLVQLGSLLAEVLVEGRVPKAAQGHASSSAASRVCSVRVAVKEGLKLRRRKVPGWQAEEDKSTKDKRKSYKR